MTRQSARVRVNKRELSCVANGVATGMHFGGGDAGLEFSVNRNQLEQFIREFRGSSELQIRFPESNANSWRADLAGTGTITESLAQCMRAMR